MTKKEKRIIQVGATLDSANRLKDGSVTLRFVTNREIPTEEYMIMDGYRQSMGYVLFRENSFKEEEIPTEDVEEDIAKSQSVQIRDALWVLFKARGNNGADKDAWNVFYKRNMQAVKTRILSEVHELEEKQ